MNVQIPLRQFIRIIERFAETHSEFLLHGIHKYFIIY